MKKLVFKKGQKFTRLTITGREISVYNKNGRAERFIYCRCDCGNRLKIRAQEIIDKHTQSCGCLARELAAKRVYRHGMAGTKFYDVYSAMVARCNNPQNKDYKEWGKRGIKCEFKSFKDFMKAMYLSYKKHVEKYGYANLDRIDNNGNYSKKNCKWSTHKEQAQNRRKRRYIKAPK